MLELSIGLTVISIIAGLAIYGTSEMIRIGKLATIIKDIGELTQGFEDFNNEYMAIPGDYAQATTRINATLTNGPGIGYIPDSAITAPATRFNVQPHLLAAGLISKKLDKGVTDSSRYYFGGGTANMIITYAEVNPTITTAADIDLAALSIFDAKYLDTKFDDGDPSTGRLRFFDGSNVTAGSCITASAFSTTNLDGKNCILKFYLR